MVMEYLLIALYSISWFWYSITIFIESTQSTLDENFYVINKTSGQTIGGTSYSEGQIIRLTPSMVTAYSTQSMTFDLGTVTKADSLCSTKVKVVDAVPTTKNLVNGRYVKIRTNDNVGGATSFLEFGYS